MPTLNALRRWGLITPWMLLCAAASQAMSPAGARAEPPPMAVAEPLASLAPLAPLERLKAASQSWTDGRALAALRATDAQAARVQAIWQAAQAALQPMHQTQQALDRQMAELLEQPEVDGVAAEALRQRILAAQDGQSRRLLQARLDSAAVFNPDQRARLAEWRAQRRQRHELLHLQLHHRPLWPEWSDDEHRG